MPEYLGNGLGGPFSLKEPYLRLYWDATCLDMFMRDLFGYVFEANGGYRSRAPQPPLVFGDLYHRCRQYYDVLRVEGAVRDEALYSTLKYAHSGALEVDLNQVTMGDKAGTCPICKGTGRIITQKAEPPQPTGEVYKRGPKAGQPKMTAGKKERSRECDSNWHAGEERSIKSLMRSLIWFDERFGAYDPVQPAKGKDSSAMVEKNFAVPLPFKAYTGEQYYLCGYLDGVVEYQGQQMPREMKHSCGNPSSFYFTNLNASTQIWCYLLISWLHFNKGESFQSTLLLDATFLGATYTDFQRKVVTRAKPQLERFIANLRYWIMKAERDHQAGLMLPNLDHFVPWSPSGQALYTRKDGTGGSAFKGCMLENPALYKSWIEERFVKSEPWNPTIEREKF